MTRERIGAWRWNVCGLALLAVSLSTLAVCAKQTGPTTQTPASGQGGATPAGAAGSVTTCTGEQPAIKAAGVSSPALTVNTRRTYTLIHTGVDSTGAAAAGLVCIGINAAPPAADWTEDNNKFPLAAGSAIVVGPYVQIIYLKAAAGAPMVSILPGPENNP